MIHEGKRNLLGIRIDAVDYEAATAAVLQAAKERRAFKVSALAVHGLMSGVLDPELKFRLNRFDLLCPDGQPVRWALNRLGGCALKERVYGPFLTLEVCAAAARAGVGIYLFGSSAEVLAKLEANLRAKFPTLIVSGRQPSRFRRATEAEVAEDVAAIIASGAGIVLAGLGCPRQEIWAYEMAPQLSLPVLAVGAAFDFHAGTLPMAPRWMQNSGLEWLYRLIQEPGRLWKRYLHLNPLYVFNCLAQKTGLRKFDPEASREPSGPLRFG